MKINVGLWIDHKKAFIVAVTDEGEETRLVISTADKQLGRIDGIRSTAPYEAQMVQADGRQERKFTGKLNIFYDAIIASVSDAESILIFGPGEAKGELQKRLESKNLGGHIVGVETVDKMTDSQIAAKVRKRFLRK
jgi:hypothetical protein